MALPTIYSASACIPDYDSDSFSDDVALVELEFPVEVVPLELKWRIREGESLTLMAYHGDDPKKLQISNCNASDVFASWWGAPVFGEGGKGVGVHIANRTDGSAAIAALISKTRMDIRTRIGCLSLY